MSVKPGTMTLAWADGDYPFRLAIGEWQELFRKTGAGPLELYTRLRDGKWHVEDLRETHRAGLIGAGMDPKEAAVLVRRYVDEQPLLRSVESATMILLSGLLGLPGDESKKATAEGETVGPSPSADSTNMAPPSDSAPATSTT